MHSLRCFCLIVIGAVCLAGCASRPSPIKLEWDYKWEEPSSVDYVREQIELAQARMEKGHYILAGWAFGRVHKHSRSLINRGNAILGKALCYYCRDKYDDAAKETMKAVELYGNYIPYAETIKLEYELAGRLNKPEKLLSFRYRELAIKLYRHLVQYAPYSKYGPLSLAAITRILRGEGGHIEATLGFEKFLTDYDNSFLVNRAGLDLIRSLLYLSERGESEFLHELRARAEMRRILATNPSKDVLRELDELKNWADNIEADHLLFVGGFYRRSAHLAILAARRYYQTLVTKFSDLEQAEEAKMQLLKIPQPAAEGKM